MESSPYWVIGFCFGCYWVGFVVLALLSYLWAFANAALKKGRKPKKKKVSSPDASSFVLGWLIGKGENPE